MEILSKVDELALCACFLDNVCTTGDDIYFAKFFSVTPVLEFVSCRTCACEQVFENDTKIFGYLNPCRLEVAEFVLVAVSQCQNTVNCASIFHDCRISERNSVRSFLVTSSDTKNCTFCIFQFVNFAVALGCASWVCASKVQTTTTCWALAFACVSSCVTFALFCTRFLCAGFVCAFAASWTYVGTYVWLTCCQNNGCNHHNCQKHSNDKFCLFHNVPPIEIKIFC